MLPMDAFQCLMHRDTSGLVVNQIEPGHTSAVPMDASNGCLSMSDAQRHLWSSGEPDRTRAYISSTNGCLSLSDAQRHLWSSGEPDRTRAYIISTNGCFQWMPLTV